VSATQSSRSAPWRLPPAPGAGRERAALAAALLAAACAYVALEPWHGPIVLALSEQHGVDTADLPALPLISLGFALAWPGEDVVRRGVWPAVAAAALGALLLMGVADPRIGSALTPAGGGTFGGATQHVDGVRWERVGRWTHLAATYDGTTYRLYVNGAEVSSGSASGRILRTVDPLWIGGNLPYGEHFQGVIDEVRVFNRALTPGGVRKAMATPVSRGAEPGLVAAYGFGAGAADASGHGNTGTIMGARGTTDGRFGRGLRFTGTATVRVPASASLNLGGAMTLMAWIKPTEHQSGWRTVVARQTDAYFLAAGGGREDARGLARLDRLRFVLLLLLIATIGVALASGRAPWIVARRRWHWPVGLFVVGSLVDVTFTPYDTLFGPLLVAAWCGATAVGRAERAAMFFLTAAFAAVTIAPPAFPLPIDAGGIVRSAALGLVLIVAALPRLRGRRAGPGPFVRHEHRDRPI
jgi:hypothetical protein